MKISKLSFFRPGFSGVRANTEVSGFVLSGVVDCGPPPPRPLLFAFVIPLLVPQDNDCV